MTTTSPQTFPYRPQAPAADIGQLLPAGHVFTLVGQVASVSLGWAGRLRCQLQMSLGTLGVVGNRDSALLDARPGDWLRVRVRRSYGSDGQPPQVCLLGARSVEPDDGLAWQPTSLYHRHAHMQRLRTVLAQLDPVLQFVFVLALPPGLMQRDFFWRVGALDHHVYPGGLFDQSVRAAELALAGPQDAGRGVVALAALLFDLGKVGAPVAPDRRRLSLPASHPQTGRCLERALAVLEPRDPRAIGELRALLTAAPETALPAPTARLAARVHAAVRQAWFAEQTDAR